MSESKKLICFGQWLVLLVVPPMFFPAFWLIAATYDWLFGDADVVLNLSYYYSKTALLHELLLPFLSDWIASLPLSFAVVWLVLIPLYIISARQGRMRIKHPLLTGGVIGLLTGFWLFHLEMSGLVVMGIAGFCLGVGLMIMQWLLCSRQRAHQ